MQISVGDLAKLLNAQAVGDTNLMVTGPSEPADAAADELALAMNAKYATALTRGAARVAILWDGADWQKLGLEAAIFVPRPRYALAMVNDVFAPKRTDTNGIHATAVIDPSANIGVGASIGPFVVIAADVVIGPAARILSHTSIGAGAVIGENCLIYNGARIGAGVKIGDNFICHANAAVGNDGFSFVSPETGAIEDARAMKQISADYDAKQYKRINSLGSVVIGDRVEIGANSTVDRGTVANTTIGSGTKLDNLVQIGHNVRIGQNCLICGQAGVAGSATLGDGVVLGGQSAVADNITIGDNVVATGQTGLHANVPANRVMMGTPAVRMETSVASYKALRRLPRLLQRFEELQKRVSKRDASD